MIKGDKDKLLAIAKDNVCSEHHIPLEVQWDDKEQSNVLYCVKGHYPDAVIRSKVEGHKAFDRNSPPLKTGFELVSKVDLGSGAALAPEVSRALERYAKQYGLDYYRGHVVLMYGQPYIGLDGYLYHANRSGIKYCLESRPMTTSELKQYKVGNTDHGWLATVNLIDTNEKFNGVGIVTYEEMTAKSPRDDTKLRSPVVAAKPWQLAQKRAEWQAMRRAFPIGESEEEI